MNSNTAPEVHLPALIWNLENPKVLYYQTLHVWIIYISTLGSKWLHEPGEM